MIFPAREDSKRELKRHYHEGFWTVFGPATLMRCVLYLQFEYLPSSALSLFLLGVISSRCEAQRRGRYPLIDTLESKQVFSSYVIVLDPGFAVARAGGDRGVNTTAWAGKHTCGSTQEERTTESTTAASAASKSSCFCSEEVKHREQATGVLCASAFGRAESFIHCLFPVSFG